MGLNNDQIWGSMGHMNSSDTNHYRRGGTLVSNSGAVVCPTGGAETHRHGLQATAALKST